VTAGGVRADRLPGASGNWGRGPYGPRCCFGGGASQRDCRSGDLDRFRGRLRVIAAIGDADDNGKKIPSRQSRRFDRKDFDKSCDRRSCGHKSFANRSFDRELCAGRGRPSPRQSAPRERAVAAPIVRAADAADARSHRPRRRAEAEYSYRHELPVLRGGDNVVHGKAQAVSGCVLLALPARVGTGPRTNVYFC
jgi:hypothetical protein